MIFKDTKITINKYLFMYILAYTNQEPKASQNPPLKNGHTQSTYTYLYVYMK